MVYSHIIHIQLYRHTCGSKINNNDERTHFFRNIYLSHFIRKRCERVAKGLCVRGELETEQTATYWSPVPLSLAALLSCSAGLLNRGPIALCWELVLTASNSHKLTPTNVLRIPLSTTGLASPRCESQLASPRVRSQLTVFFFSKLPRIPLLPDITSFTPQSHFHTWGFYYDICDCHILCARVWTPALRAE